MSGRFYRKLVMSNLAATCAAGPARREALIQAVMMFANNCIFFSIWYFIFGRFDRLGEWEFRDIMFLYGLVSFSFGVCAVFAYGSVELGRHILSGSLDRHLLQPHNPLLKVVLSRSNASGFGDIASGILLIALSGRLAGAGWWMLPAMAAVGGILFTAGFVLFQCALFWKERWGEFMERLNDFLVSLSVYPQNVFDGVFRVALFTVIPAGYIGFLPVEMVRDFSPVKLVWYLTGAGAYAWAAWAVFRAGLRRYQSSQEWGR